MSNKPKNYRVGSWLALIFLNLIAGAIALYYSFKTDEAYNRGDITQSLKYSRRTLLFIRVGFILLILGLILILVSKYNSLVLADEDVKKNWSYVESQYQRRSDLIPNVVASVQRESSFERSTLTEVIDARAKATSITVNPEALSPEEVKTYESAQANLSKSLGRLLVTVENYPNLRANEGFRGLQYQLIGTENRIITERRRYNESVRSYNQKVRSFPNNLVANMFGFQIHPTFEGDPGTQYVPKLNFDSTNNRG